MGRRSADTRCGRSSVVSAARWPGPCIASEEQEPIVAVNSGAGCQVSTEGAERSRELEHRGASASQRFRPSPA